MKKAKAFIGEGPAPETTAPDAPARKLDEELVRQIVGEIVYTVCKQLIKKEVQEAMAKTAVTGASRGLI